jgi:K+-sensing histidine kinase KdpD
MNRASLIHASRWATTVATIAIIVVPLGYGIFSLVNHYAGTYPTLYLVSLAASVGIIVLLVTLLLPPIRGAVTRALFPGSFDYDAAVRSLAEEIIHDARIVDVTKHISKILKSIIGVESVRLLTDTTVLPHTVRNKKHLAVLVPQSGSLSSTILLNNKSNGDEWSKSDERLLDWFASSVAVRLRVAQERDRELRRLKQVKESVIKATNDLAELNRTLHLRERDYAKRLDEMAHDLKNPVIRMLNALDKETWTRPEVRREKVFLEVRAELKWIAKFIDQLLELSRAGAGKVTLKKQIIFLHDIVEDAMAEIKQFAHEQGKQINWNTLVHSMEDTQIIGDEGLIFKLLILLLTRATRLSLSGIELSVTTDLATTEAHVDILFSPHSKTQPAPHRQLFKQIDTPTIDEDRKFGITGLELSIAQWTLETHGGKLTVPEADQSRMVIRATIPIRSVAKKPAEVSESLIS